MIVFATNSRIDHIYVNCYRAFAVVGYQLVLNYDKSLSNAGKELSSFSLFPHVFGHGMGALHGVVDLGPCA